MNKINGAHMSARKRLDNGYYVYGWFTNKEVCAYIGCGHAGQRFEVPPNVKLQAAIDGGSVTFTKISENLTKGEAGVLAAGLIGKLRRSGKLLNGHHPADEDKSDCLRLYEETLEGLVRREDRHAAYAV
jgi:hypothetical protein